jgi:phage baseplate assembly protein W
MKDIKLLGDDIAMDNGDFLFVEGPDELQQTVYIGMQTNQGEWFLNPNVGMRHSTFVGKKPNEEAMRAEVVRGATQDDRIRTVDEVQFVQDSSARKLSVTFKAAGTDGTTIEEGVNIDA